MKAAVLVGCLIGCSIFLPKVHAAGGGKASKAAKVAGPSIDLTQKPIGNSKAPQGGTFYINLGAEPTTINPITRTDAYSAKVLEKVSDSLMVVNDDTYEYSPGLAEKMEVSNEGMTFTFTLRKGVTFHDGKPMTAEDVKFSYDVIWDDTYNAAHLRPYFEGIDRNIEILDPMTIRFHLKEKYFGNFEVLATQAILPKHIYGNSKEGVKLNKVITGTGAYKLEKWEQGQRITLVRNKEWWGHKVEKYKGSANFDKIVMRFAKETDIALEMMKKGEIDFEMLSAEAYVKKTVGEPWGTKLLKFKVENKAPKDTGFVMWNLRRDLFKDKNVRIALAHLMNRELMNEKFRYGMSLLAIGPWYQQSEYADAKVKPFLFDMKKATELLNKAGWTDSDKNGILDKVVNGNKTEFKFTIFNVSQDFEKYLTLYQEDLKKAGIQMDIRTLEWNAMIKKIDEADFDAVPMAWGGGSVDYDPKQIWHSSSAVKGGSNYINYNNPEVDKLIEEARKELDKSKRIPMLQKVYRMIAEDAPYAFMFNPKFQLYAVNARVDKPKDTYKFTLGTPYWWIKPAQ